MIKVRILKESITEELLDEAKEDNLFASYWSEHESDFRSLLVWIYGRHSGPGMWQGTVPNMLKKFKEDGKEFAPERHRRIKYLNWITDMHKVGYKPRAIVASLKIFEKFSPQFKNKEIKSYGSPDDILATYKKEIVMKRVGKSRKDRGKSELLSTEDDRVIVYEDEHLFVIRPHNVEASCHYGRKTKWCIAQPGNDYFKDYTEDEGKAFYFIKDDRRKPDDRYAKVAIQVGLMEDDEVKIEGFWDRYDNEGIQSEPRNIGELDEFFGKEIYNAIEAIDTHAQENPPVRGSQWALEELETEIDNGNYNTKVLGFYATTDFYGGPGDSYISINAEINHSVEISALHQYEDDDIRVAWEKREEIILDRLEELATEDLYQEVDLENTNFELDNIAPWNIKYSISIESRSWTDADDAREYCRDLENSYGDEGLEDFQEKMTEIVLEELMSYLNAEGREEISNIAAGIWNLESKLKHFEASYEEEDHEIYFMQKQGFRVPLKIKPFNIELKGYAPGAERDRSVKRYVRFILRFSKAPVKFAIQSAMEKVDVLARQAVFKQQTIPGVDVKKTISNYQQFPRHLEVMVGLPGQGDIKGDVKSDSPEIRANINIWITKLQTKEAMDFTIDYIKWVDNHLNEIYEEAMNNLDLDSIQKQIDDTYAEIFVDSASMQAIKHTQGYGQETYTESKKRIKIRIK
jgi:hypothetical protein